MKTGGEGGARVTASLDSLSEWSCDRDRPFICSCINLLQHIQNMASYLIHI